MNTCRKPNSVINMTDLKCLITLVICVVIAHAEEPVKKMSAMKQDQVTNPCNHAVVKTFCGFFSDINHLEEEMYASKRSPALPAVNAVETLHGYRFEMALPGYQKKDLQLMMEEDVLTVQAIPGINRKKDVQRFYKQEFVAGEFIRSFLLPDDADSATAHFANGVLTIRLMKTGQSVRREGQLQIHIQ